jgi:hypothetical protein
VDLNAEEAGNEWVCLKVIKNSKDFFDQSLDEIKLLQYINSKGDPHKHNVLKVCLSPLSARELSSSSHTDD